MSYIEKKQYMLIIPLGIFIYIAVIALLYAAIQRAGVDVKKRWNIDMYNRCGTATVAGCLLIFGGVTTIYFELSHCVQVLYYSRTSLLNFIDRDVQCAGCREYTTRCRGDTLRTGRIDEPGV